MNIKNVKISEKKPRLPEPGEIFYRANETAVSRLEMISADGIWLTARLTHLAPLSPPLEWREATTSAAKRHLAPASDYQDRMANNLEELKPIIMRLLDEERGTYEFLAKDYASKASGLQEDIDLFKTSGPLEDV